MNVYIEGDRTSFLSKRSIDKLKLYLKNNLNSVTNECLKKISNQYLKNMYFLNLIDKNQNEIKLKICHFESNNQKILENKRYLELKLNELRQKRMSHQQLDYIKEKTIKRNQNNEQIKKVFEEYENIKKLTKNPILNPTDVYKNKNKNQYTPIVKELVESFGEHNPFGKYYKLLLQTIS
jgi:hypothetical protein